MVATAQLVIPRRPLRLSLGESVVGPTVILRGRQELQGLSPLPRPIAGHSRGVFGAFRSVFLPGLLLLMALSACDDPSAEELVRRAETYRQEGKFSASIIELKDRKSVV